MDGPARWVVRWPVHVPGTSRPRWQVPFAVAVAAADLVAVVVMLVAVADREVQHTVEETGSWVNLVAGPTFPLVAALLLRGQVADESGPVADGRRRLAWLMLGFGVLGTATFVLHFSAQAALDRDAPGAAALGWVSTWLWIGVPTGLLLLLLWFPTGQVPGPRWRIGPGLLAVAAAGMWASVAFRPGESEDFPGWDNPLGAPAAATALRVLGVIGGSALAAAAVVTVASVGWRFWSGSLEVRAQLRWLLVAVALMTLTVVLPVPEHLHLASDALGLLTALLLPVTLAVALLRRDDVVLPRLLVFGLLSTVLLGGYLALVGAAHAAFGSSADGVVALAAAGVVAVAAAPLRARLQRSVDRLVYGDRGDPYAALTDLGRRITGSPDDLLAEVVQAVAAALRSPYVAVHLGEDPTPAAEAGHPSNPRRTVSVPLLLHGRPAGSLFVAQRTSREPFGRRDLALLDGLAPQVAVAAHAAALTRDLRASRESLVLAREEERRRIRRDLHDGLGPALAGVAFGIDAARRSLPRDAAGLTDVDSSLAQLTAEVQAAVADVRRLVHDLRPPVLDQLGLLPAVQEYAARLTERGGPAISVSTSQLPPLPAAVEVAAYRTVTEALTNVARHSGARRSSVTFQLEPDALRIEVADDGCGIPDRRTGTGVGLAAMAERAAELGGSCTVRTTAGGGTCVVARLPLGAAR
ncbi:MAG: sensor histidine kinase [Actinomycetes bacterium]